VRLGPKSHTVGDDVAVITSADTERSVGWHRRLRASPETRLPACWRREQCDGVPENYFDAWVAQRYEDLWPHLFDPHG